MPFVLRNAPTSFQLVLDIILSRVQRKMSLVYIDDMVIFSKDNPNHVKDIDKLLELLHQALVTLKPPNCHIIQNKLNTLAIYSCLFAWPLRSGTLIQLRPLSFRQNAHKWSQFLGACNVYRRFMNSLFRIAPLLSVILRKNKQLDWVEFLTEAMNAFSFIDISGGGSSRVGLSAATQTIHERCRRRSICICLGSCFPPTAKGQKSWWESYNRLLEQDDQ